MHAHRKSCELLRDMHHHHLLHIWATQTYQHVVCCQEVDTTALGVSNLTSSEILNSRAITASALRIDYFFLSKDASKDGLYVI